MLEAVVIYSLFDSEIYHYHYHMIDSRGDDYGRYFIYFILIRG